MTWAAVGSTAASVGGSLLQSSMNSPPKYGGGYDYINKDMRTPISNVGKDVNAIYGANKSGLNDWMTAGLEGLANMGQTYQPYIDYGQSMLNAGGQGAGGALDAAGRLSAFNPYTSNAQYQAGQSYGPQYDYGTAMGMMSMAPGFINPMLQSIAGMNQRTLGENWMPDMAGNAIGSGNTTSSKWGTNNAILQRGMMDANAQAASGLYGQMGQQAMEAGSQYGLSAGDWKNQMERMNTELGNTLGFRQSMENAGMQNQYGISALEGAGNIYGNVLNQSNPYFSQMIQMLAGIPQSQYAAGQMKMNAPLDWANSNLATMLQVGSAGAPTSSGVGGGGNSTQGKNWGSMFGELANQAITGWQNRKSDPYDIGVNKGSYNGPW